MIKVFTTGDSPSQAGSTLTKMINEWLEGEENNVEILHIHSNSNKFGWMIVIQYKYYS